MCVFCKIIQGTIPAYKIYEDEHFIAILDIAPAAVGHTLIISKKHIDSFFSLDKSTSEKLGWLTVLLSNHLKKILDAENMNILSNAGPYAGQTVDHFHLHLIPRYADDDVTFKYKAKVFSKLEFISLAKALRYNGLKE